MRAHLRRYGDMWLPYLAAFAVAAYTFFSVHALINKQNATNRERRNDTCLGFEGTHRQEIRNLENTYKYLLSVPPAERRRGLSGFILRFSLPEAERAAMRDDDFDGVYVPHYCDEPNVGLPEPDPTVPQRPKGLEP